MPKFSIKCAVVITCMSLAWICLAFCSLFGPFWYLVYRACHQNGRSMHMARRRTRKTWLSKPVISSDVGLVCSSLTSPSPNQAHQNKPLFSVSVFFVLLAHKPLSVSSQFVILCFLTIHPNSLLWKGFSVILLCHQLSLSPFLYHLSKHQRIREY